MKKSADSSLLDIEDILPDKDKYIKDLEEKCFNLNKTLFELNKTLQQYVAENAHLKKLLEGSTNLISPISDEEEIAIAQLERIKQISRERRLTLEEAKIYDTLVKNKRLAQGDVTNINGVKSLPKGLDKKELIQIAKVKKHE